MRKSRLASWSVVLLLTAVAVGGLASYGSGKTRNQPSRNTPILIGVDAGLSGFMTAYDVPVLHAAQLAVQDINRRGGVLGRRLKIVTGDYHSTVNDSGPVARGLVSQGVKLLITACDYNLGAPAALVAKASNVPAFSCAGTVQYGVQGIGPNAYTFAPAGQSEGAAMAEFAVKVKHIKTAWTLRDTSLLYYSATVAGFTSRFKQLGGRIVGAQTFSSSDPSIATQITQLRSLSSPPGVIFLASLPSGGAGAMRQLRAAGFNQPIMSTNTYDGDFWKGAVPNISNVYFTTFGSLYGDDPDPKVNAFIRRYKNTFGGGTPASSILLTGYSMIQAFAMAAEKAGAVDGNKIVHALDTMGTLPLLVGPTTFTPNLHIDLLRRQSIMQVQNGKTHFLRYWQLTKAPSLAVGGA